MSKQFRFNAQKVFLTYPRTVKRISPEVLRRKLNEKAEVQDYLIAQERHVDGGYHLHAYVKFTSKLDTKDQRYFDVVYYGKNYHPNVQKPLKVHKLWEYIKKSGNYITNIAETRPRWLVALEDLDDKQEFLTFLMWEIGRLDNYAGYRTLRDLWDLKNDNTIQPTRSDQIRQRLVGKQADKYT